MIYLKDNIYHQSGKDNEIIVQEYFNRIKTGDLEELLELFSDDAIIHEPFSKSKHLFGKSEIRPFLKSVIMANEGLQYKIHIERQKNSHTDNFIALVIFRRGQAINSKFTFSFENTHESKLNRKIKALSIEFMD